MDAMIGQVSCFLLLGLLLVSVAVFLFFYPLSIRRQMTFPQLDWADNSLLSVVNGEAKS